MSRIHACPMLVLLLVLTTPASGQADSEYSPHQLRAMEQVTEKTGFRLVEPEGAEDAYMAREVRGYRVVLMGAVGDVWRRWAARVAAGEVGRELGGIWAHLTGSTEYGPGVTGSVFDQMLSGMLGQPMSVSMILYHGKEHAPRVDVLSRNFPYEVDDLAPRHSRISLRTGHLHSDDEAFADALAGDDELVERFRRLGEQYLRIDEETVSFYWAGDERNYSGLINRHGDYFNMVNELTGLLADLADRVADMETEP